MGFRLAFAVAQVAGNVISPKVLGSVEYACAVAGAKLVLVMGHTRCGAVTAAVSLASSHANAAEATGRKHLEPIIQDIQKSLDSMLIQKFEQSTGDEQSRCVDEVARRNVALSVTRILEQSQTIKELADTNCIAVIGAMYDVVTGKIDLLDR